MPGSQEKYGVPVLPHPGNPFPQICLEGFPARNELPIEMKSGMVLPRHQEKTGAVVDAQLVIGKFSIDGEFDVADLVEPDWGNAFLGNHWGLEYILFPHEVVLRFDLRTTEVEQLCHQVVKQFPPQKNFSFASSSKRTVSSGQTVPDLGWKDGFQGVPKWTGPVNAPRIILHPEKKGIVHVIFDLTQPKLQQWEAAKNFLALIQARHVGKIKKMRANPNTWENYLRILDAWDFNPDPDNFKVTHEKIGEIILCLDTDSQDAKDFAKARASQDYTQATRLLNHFPY